MHTSIEIAHIYGDEAFGEEQKRGLAYARHFIENIQGGTFSTVILVDDVHAEMKLNVDKYIRLVELEGVVVDHVMMESHMIPAAQELMERLTVPILSQSFDRGQRIQKGIEDKDERWIALTNEGVPSCACLAAAFNLVRFGNNRHPINGEAAKPADRIVNILPQRFMNIEEKALQILQSSVHAAYAGKIDHIFHG